MPKSHPEYERGFRDGFESAQSDTRSHVGCSCIAVIEAKRDEWDDESYQSSAPLSMKVEAANEILTALQAKEK